MEINIGEKIFNLRKEKSITQEQLAHYLNVSSAAVSKWESKRSYPDIALLPDIANYFKVSTDFLLGYDYVVNTVDEIILRSNELIKEKRYEDTYTLLQKSLKDFPNNLELNMYMARYLLSRSLNQKNIDKVLAKEALNYFDKSLSLDINGKHHESLIQNKSFLMASIGMYEEANKLLLDLKNNKYLVQIANNYIKSGNIDKGMKLLQNHLGAITFEFSWLIHNLNTCFKKLGKNDKVYELTKMSAVFREFMSNADEANYYNLLSSHDFFALALLEKEQKREDLMWENLEKSFYHAKRFDDNPNYEVCKVNFMDGLKGSYDNDNNLAIPYLKSKLEENFSEYKSLNKYKALVE